MREAWLLTANHFFASLQVTSKPMSWVLKAIAVGPRPGKIVGFLGFQFCYEKKGA